MNNKNAIAIIRIMTILLIIGLAILCFIIGLPLFVGYLIIFNLGTVIISDFLFIIIMTFGIPIYCILILIHLLKIYKVIKDE